MKTPVVFFALLLLAFSANAQEEEEEVKYEGNAIELLQIASACPKELAKLSTIGYPSTASRFNISDAISVLKIVYMSHRNALTKNDDSSVKVAPLEVGELLVKMKSDGHQAAKYKCGASKY